ncbi:MAG: glycoside hydrolase family 127 protein [Prevotella sp.]|nr:glycoside hydrolase family 127 protein [Prevotella sp.]
MKIKPTIIAILIILLGSSHTVAQQVCEPFSLTQVHLLPSRFRDNMRRDSAWMMSIPVKRLLHSFRNTAGAFSDKEGGYMTMPKLGGWESLDCDLRGHITGHLLSALATLYAQTQSAEVKAKSDSIIEGLREVQQIVGTGYLSAFGEGLIERNIQGKSVWAPWYTLHKIAQGLIDQYQLCGSDTALVMARRMADWAYSRLRPLSEETRKLMIRNEFGGFNEAMYELYALTHENRYLWLARFFYHNDKIDPLKAGNDDLGTNHANTFIPKLLGEARNYELFGEKTSREAAELLFRVLADDHAFVTGELSDKEHLFKPSAQSKHISGYDGENCCTFNLLKLADHVFSWTADVRVADYYERALYNHILGQQDPETSMVCYFTPLMTGSHRLYSTRDSSFWCCVGSGFESHVKYASSIYFHSQDKLWVNLFIPSRVDFEGTTLTQTTRFPEEGVTRFTFGGKSRHMSLMLRVPAWATSMSVKVNGRLVKTPKEVAPAQTMGKDASVSRTGLRQGYVEIARTWKKGDRVEVNYGMSLHEETTRDSSSRRVLLYGPIVMAGRLSDVEHPFSDPKLYNDYYTYDFKVPAELRKVGGLGRLDQLKRLSPLHYKALSGIDIIPFYDAHHCRYVVYWDE